VAGAAALALPVVLAFFGGGFGVRRATMALLFVLPILAVCGALAPRPLVPRGWPRVALAALAAYTAWAAISIAWARILGDASEDVWRLVLYCAAFLLALIGLREPTLRRHAPHVLLAGSTVVALYALAGRLAPSVVEQTETALAGDRLSQPLTYWNAMGILMAMAIVLAVATAADERLAPRRRALAAAAAIPCFAALHLTFSRASYVALAAGLVFVLVLRPTRRQLAAAVLVLVPGVVLVGAIEALPAVSSIGHPDATRTRQGLAFAALVLAASAAAGVLLERLARRPDPGPLPLSRALRTAVLVATIPAVLAAGAFVASRGERVENVPTGAGRVTTLDTNRDQLWSVAFEAFSENPVTGIGMASFQVEWLREREERNSALDAHSLYVETLAELGVVGALLLAAFLVAVAAGIVRRGREAPGDPAIVAAAGLLVAFAVHAGFDWDWEMPTVSLAALVLAAAALQPAGADPAEN
jgi:O-antigen ligase